MGTNELFAVQQGDDAGEWHVVDARGNVVDSFYGAKGKADAEAMVKAHNARVR